MTAVQGVAGGELEGAELTPLAFVERSERASIIGELQVFLDDHPTSADKWYQLGVALNAAGRYEEAAAAHHIALTLSPHNRGVQCELAFALASVGSLEEAASLLEEVIQCDPGNGWAYFHLACARYRQGACAEASLMWEVAVRCLDDPCDSLENLAMVYRRLGDTDRELSCWWRLAEIQPDSPAVVHMLGAVGLAPTPLRASNGYVVQLFDRFAPDFDYVLKLLDYAVPEMIEAWMHTRFPQPQRSLRILDVGCGTGLCGQRLRPWASELVGVDLSPEMLSLAQQRDLYDSLIEAEVVDYLECGGAKFDVIVASDVLCYFGDLRAFGRHALAALRPAGWLAFSVELIEEKELGTGYVLESHGRYAHEQSHVEAAMGDAAEYGATKSVLRLEAGVPVAGLWVEASAAR